MSRTWDIFITLSRHIVTYSERCVTLHIVENPAIFRILAYLGPQAYSESCLYKHIQAYSDIFDSDSYNKINFLTHFPTKFKKTCFLTTMTSISMLDWVYLDNTRSFKIRYSRTNKTHIFLRKQILGQKRKFSDKMLSHQK